MQLEEHLGLLRRVRAAEPLAEQRDAGRGVQGLLDGQEEGRGAEELHVAVHELPLAFESVFGDGAGLSPQLLHQVFHQRALILVGRRDERVEALPSVGERGDLQDARLDLCDLAGRGGGGGQVRRGGDSGSGRRGCGPPRRAAPVARRWPCKADDAGPRPAAEEERTQEVKAKVCRHTQESCAKEGRAPTSARCLSRPAHLAGARCAR
mmetsp:Transcript_125126/g.325068  ORF Transcript_125126/g.325068 Transcript_125126/m.325068 type:complete len:208 (+) Transcript_125126:522-1145(+)